MATSIGLGQFARRMDVLSELFAGGVERTVRRAALAADTTVVLLTPVDTGRARANWTVSVGSPQEVVKDAPGSPQAGTSEALTQGQAAIAKYRLRDGGIFLNNSLPYIVPLDNGSSQQAPSGFSKQAIEAARRQLQRARVLRQR